MDGMSETPLPLSSQGSTLPLFAPGPRRRVGMPLFSVLVDFDSLPTVRAPCQVPSLRAWTATR
jgi:hypothetical protein